MKSYEHPTDLLALAAAGLLEPEELDAAQEAARAQPELARELSLDFGALSADPVAAPPALSPGGWAALEARLDSAPVERSPAAASDLASLISIACIYCHDGLARAEARYCASCLAPHHGECFEAHGHCAAPGCSEVLTVQPSAGASPLPARPLTARPRRRLLVALAAGALLAGGGGVAAFQARHGDRAAQGEALARSAPRPSPAGSSAAPPAPTTSPPDELRLRWLLGRGEELLEADRPHDAADAFCEAIDLAPASWQGYEGRARASAAAGDQPGLFRYLGEAAARAREPAVKIDLTLRLARLWDETWDYERAREVLSAAEADLAAETSEILAPLRWANESLLLREADPFEALASESGRELLSQARTLSGQSGAWLQGRSPGASERWAAELGFALRRGDTGRARALAEVEQSDLAGASLACVARLLTEPKPSPALLLRKLSAPQYEPALASALLALLSGREGSTAASAQRAKGARSLGRSPLTPSGAAFLAALPLAQQARSSKNPEDLRLACRALVRVWQLNPLHVESLLERSQLYARFGRLEAAEAAVDAALRLDPTFSAAHAWRGYLFLEELPLPRRDSLRAGQAFARALEFLGDQDAPTLRAHALRGRALASLAELNLPARGDLTLDDGRAFSNVSYRDLGEELELLLELGSLRVPKSRVVRLVALRAAGASRSEQARRELLEQVKADLYQAIGLLPERYPEASPLQLQRMLAYLQDLAAVHLCLGEEDLVSAVNFRRATTLKSVSEAVASLIARAQEHGDRFAFEEAIQALGIAVELAPEASQARTTRGTYYLKTGNFLSGLRDYAVAIELDPSVCETLWRKVYQISYVVDLNRVIAELNQRVARSDQLQDRFLRGFFWLAKMSFKQTTHEDLELGIQDLNRCVEARPESGAYYLFRGLLYEAGLRLGTHQEREALADLRRASELSPDSGMAWSGVARLELIHGRVEACYAALERAREHLSPERFLELHGEQALAPLQGQARYEALVTGVKEPAKDTSPRDD